MIGVGPSFLFSHLLLQNEIQQTAKPPRNTSSCNCSCETSNILQCLTRTDLLLCQERNTGGLEAMHLGIWDQLQEKAIFNSWPKETFTYIHYIYLASGNYGWTSTKTRPGLLQRQCFKMVVAITLMYRGDESTPSHRHLSWLLDLTVPMHVTEYGPRIQEP